jgi:putative transposase
MERKINFSINEYYHVYNRGNNKSLIFLDDFDNKRFIKLLFLCNSSKPVVFKTVQGMPLDKIERGETLVDIGAYCLMPNHFHLLIKEKQENGISIFMEKLSTGYSMYFNKKYDRTGKLFEGRFRAEHLDSDEYLKYIFMYIHLNPVKIFDPNWKEQGVNDLLKIKDYLYTYNNSSYLDFLEVPRREVSILNIKAFPEYFTSKQDFLKEIDEWLNHPRGALG